MRAILLLVMAALPAAAISYFNSDSFGSGGGTWTGAGWVQNGTLSGSSPNGLYSSSTGGGSVILGSQVTNPTTFQIDTVYELKATFRIQASGGTFVLYSHATTNALAASGNTGTFYAATFTPV